MTDSLDATPYTISVHPLGPLRGRTLRDELVVTAFHEAAHFVALVWFRRFPLIATIEPNPAARTLGAVYLADPRAFDGESRQAAIMKLIGLAVEERLDHPAPVQGSLQDIAGAATALRNLNWAFHRDADAVAFDESLRAARDLVREPKFWAAVEYVAAQLLRWKTLREPACLELVFEVAERLFGRAERAEVCLWPGYIELHQRTYGTVPMHVFKALQQKQWPLTAVLLLWMIVSWTFMLTMPGR